MATPCEVVPSINPALVTVALISNVPKMPLPLPSMTPPASLMTNNAGSPPSLPTPTILSLTLVSVNPPPLSVIRLLPPDIDTVPPPESVTLCAMNRVVWLELPKRLMLPALLSVAPPSVSVAPFRTLTAPELTSTPKSVALTTTSRLPPAELIAVPPLKIVMSMAVPPLWMKSLPPRKCGRRHQCRRRGWSRCRR